MKRTYRLTDLDLVLLWIIGSFAGVYLVMLLLYLGVI